MSDEILGYRKTGKDEYTPIIQPRGYMYTAALIMCKECNEPISGMGGPDYNSYCCKCADKLNLLGTQ